MDYLAVSFEMTPFEPSIALQAKPMTTKIVGCCDDRMNNDVYVPLCLSLTLPEVITPGYF